MLYSARFMLAGQVVAAGPPPLSAISFKSSKTLTGTTGTSGTQVIDISSFGLATGQVCIISLVFGDVVTDRVFTCSGNASGAATIVADQYANGTTDTNQLVALLIQGATPDTSITVGGLATTAWPYAITASIWNGVNLTTPQDVAATVVTGINASFPNPPAITPVTAGAKIVLAYAAARATNDAWTVPSDVDVFWQQASATLKAKSGMGYKSWASGAFDAAVLTGGTSVSADSWCAAALALRPATTLDTQTVTVDQTGAVSVRTRGFRAAGPLGSISDGTSNIFGGAAITEMYADEDVSEFYLAITGATNSGWTTLTNATDGTSLTRASATFASGRWTWAGQTLTSFFTSNSGDKTVIFT